MYKENICINKQDKKLIFRQFMSHTVDWVMFAPYNRIIPGTANTYNCSLLYLTKEFNFNRFIKIT